MSRFWRYFFAASVVAPILFWFGYALVYKTKVADSAGGDLFFLLWGAHLIVAYILNWSMFTVVIKIKPGEYFSFERVAGVASGILLYGFFFIRLIEPA